jgi:hypothetical protein
MASSRPVTMEKVQEALANDDFLWFLNNNFTYTNGPFYFEYIQDWINKANTGPSQHKQDYLRRALKLFNIYYKQFLNISPSLLPSFHFSFSPLFPERKCLLGWPYSVNVQCKQIHHTKNTKNQYKINLDAFLHDLINKSYKESDHHKSCDDNYAYIFEQKTDFNSPPIHYKPQYQASMSGTINVITFKFNWNSILQLIFTQSYAPRKKKERIKTMHVKDLCCQGSTKCSIITLYRDKDILVFDFIEISFVFSFVFSFNFLLYILFSWNLFSFYLYIIVVWEIWGFFLLFMLGIDRGTLPRISDGIYLHIVRNQSSTKKMTVKEEEFLVPTRFQGLALFLLLLAGRDWKCLDAKRICELVVFFGIYFTDFLLLCFLFSFVRLFLRGFVGKNYFFFFLFLSAAQQVLESPILYDHRAVC